MLFGYDKEHFITLPTPIQHLPAISAITGCEFFIKRDDMTDLGMGGNKLRKLEYLLWDAKRQGGLPMAAPKLITADSQRRWPPDMA